MSFTIGGHVLSLLGRHSVDRTASLVCVGVSWQSLGTLILYTPKYFHGAAALALHQGKFGFNVRRVSRAVLTRIRSSLSYCTVVRSASYLPFWSCERVYGRFRVPYPDTGSQAWHCIAECARRAFHIGCAVENDENLGGGRSRAKRCSLTRARCELDLYRGSISSRSSSRRSARGDPRMVLGTFISECGLDVRYMHCQQLCVIYRPKARLMNIFINDARTAASCCGINPCTHVLPKILGHVCHGPHPTIDSMRYAPFRPNCPLYQTTRYMTSISL